LEPIYTVEPVSQVGRNHTNSASSDIERLVHAPPGYVHALSEFVVLINASVVLVTLV
jgi:hypothetical protein